MPYAVYLDLDDKRYYFVDDDDDHRGLFSLRRGSARRFESREDAEEIVKTSTSRRLEILELSPDDIAEKRRCLLVGGPWHGHRVEASLDARIIEMHDSTNGPVSYHRGMIRGGTEMCWTFYHHYSMTADEAINHILISY